MQRVTTHFAVAVAIFVFAVSFGACSSSGPAKVASTATRATITIHNFSFHPSTLTVKAGTTITVKILTIPTTP